jgi:uncharacterized protein (TIGR03435 family)
MTRPMLAVFLLASPLLIAQPLTFEVASVKPAADPGRVPMFCIVPCAPGERLTVEGNRVDIRFMSLTTLIETAYGLKHYQLAGPDWMRSTRFDILAKLPDGATKVQIPAMLKSLLAERFKLAVRREPREQAVYALVVGKNGSKLQPPPPDAEKPAETKPGDQELYSPQGDAHVDSNGMLSVSSGPFGPIRAGKPGPGGHDMDFLKVTMPGLADLLTPHMDHPVIDKTELTGAYHIPIHIQLPDMPEGDGVKGPPSGGRKGGGPGDGGPPPQDILGDAFRRAIDKAGLRLEPRRAPIDTLVVDHLEKTPTEN